jgi:hypothetical protein
MSEEGDDNLTVIIGDDELSQDLQNEREQNPMVLKIVQKQKEIRDEMLKLQGKMEVLNELLIEYFVGDVEEDNGSAYDT